jgi:hypothetical protein
MKDMFQMQTYTNIGALAISLILDLGSAEIQETESTDVNTPIERGEERVKDEERRWEKLKERMFMGKSDGVIFDINGDADDLILMRKVKAISEFGGMRSCVNVLI